MIELARIIEHQANLSSYRATQNEKHAEQLELLFETTKPKNLYPDWHPLIATPFRYRPIRPARFRPLPYGKNIFYGATTEETALYEHAYHFMKERIAFTSGTQNGTRTIFTVNADRTHAIDVRHEKNVGKIIDKNDYAASYEFIAAHPRASFILYPSCRDPQQRDNAAVLAIQHLQKVPHWQTTINFFYDNKKRQLTWLEYQLHIQWAEVS